MIETLGQWILVGIFFTAFGMWYGWYLRGIWISSFLDPEVRNAEEKKIADLRETVGVEENTKSLHLPKACSRERASSSKVDYYGRK